MVRKEGTNGGHSLCEHALTDKLADSLARCW